MVRGNQYAGRCGATIAFEGRELVPCRPKIMDVSPPTLRTGDVLTIRGVGLNDVIQAGGWDNDRDGYDLKSTAVPGLVYEFRLVLVATSNGQTKILLGEMFYLRKPAGGTQ